MNSLNDRINRIIDLRVQRDRSAYRYYNIENQIILLDMITEELKQRKRPLTKEIYSQLSNPEKLADRDIKALAQLLSQVLKM